MASWRAAFAHFIFMCSLFVLSNAEEWMGQAKPYVMFRPHFSLGVQAMSPEFDLSYFPAPPLATQAREQAGLQTGGGIRRAGAVAAAAGIVRAHMLQCAPSCPPPQVCILV